MALKESINATVREIAVYDEAAVLQPGATFRIGSEYFTFEGYARTEAAPRGTTYVTTRWLVKRGTAAASHSADATIAFAPEDWQDQIDAVVADVAEITGLPTGWTQDPETGAVDTGGQDFTAATLSPAPTLAAVLNVSGDAPDGSITGLGEISGRVSGMVVGNVLDPTHDQDAATKAYADALVASYDATGVIVQGSGTINMDLTRSWVKWSRLGDVVTVAMSLVTAAGSEGQSGQEVQVVFDGLPIPKRWGGSLDPLMLLGMVQSNIDGLMQCWAVGPVNHDPFTVNFGLLSGAFTKMGAGVAVEWPNVLFGNLIYRTETP